MLHRNRLVHVLLVGALLTYRALAADIWVSGSGSNSNPGTETLPYRTITFAMSQASAGDVLKVKTGTYDVDAGESFPIDIKHNVDIIGQASAQADWPRIGGDASESSSVEAFLRVTATSGNRSGIDIKRLYFIGEEFSETDGPSALIVRVNSGNTGIVIFESNFCERAKMGDVNGSNDRPTVLIEGGWGNTIVTILNCDNIEPSQPGGVLAVTGTDTTSTHRALIQVTLWRSTIMLPSNGDDADYGFAFLASGDEYVEGRLTIRGNIIDSTVAQGHGGINYGVAVELRPDGNGEADVPDAHTVITGNRIIGRHNNAGIRLLSAPLSPTATGELSVSQLERNYIHGRDVNGRAGTGLVVQRSEEGSYGGEVNVVSRGNVYADHELNIEVVDGADGIGEFHMLNDTITGSQSYGIRLRGVGASNDAWIDSLTGCIVHGNFGGGAQYDAGATGWDPSDSTSWGSVASYCDFQNSSGGVSNIDVDPEFVDAAAGDYHLLSTSDCIDVGDNAPDVGTVLAEFDLDGEDRIDATSPMVVDLGADEYYL